VASLPSVDLTTLRGDWLHSAYHLLPAAFLLALLIDPEGEVTVFLKNVGGLLPNYAALLYVTRLTRHCSSNASMLSVGDLICPLISDVN
jgi:hypothetical protein